MFRIVAICLNFSIIIITSIKGQNLSNTQWYKVGIERADSSRIISRDNPDHSPLQFIFKKDVVLYSTHGQAPDERKYNILENKLKIGDFVTYQMDLMNDSILILTEITERAVNTDRLTRLYLLRSDFYLKNLIKENQITIIGDTLVLCKQYFSPIYETSGMGLLFSGFSSASESRSLSGSFVLSSTSEVISIELNSYRNFSKREIDKFKKIFVATSGSWLLPEIGNEYFFKMDFQCTFTSIRSFSSVRFKFHNEVLEGEKTPVFSLSKMKKAQNYFEKGQLYLKKEKYERAGIEFNKCIEIDSIYIEAYYYKAYSFTMTDDLKTACSTYKELIKMDQKKAELLYSEICK